METFFNTCLSIIVKPEIIISGLIVGIYFSNIPILKFLKRLCIISVLLQSTVVLTNIFDKNVLPAKINSAVMIKDFFPRAFCLFLLSLIIYYGIAFIAKKIETVYKATIS